MLCQYYATYIFIIYKTSEGKGNFKHIRLILVQTTTITMIPNSNYWEIDQRKKPPSLNRFKALMYSTNSFLELKQKSDAFLLIHCT